MVVTSWNDKIIYVLNTVCMFVAHLFVCVHFGNHNIAASIENTNCHRPWHEDAFSLSWNGLCGNVFYYFTKLYYFQLAFHFVAFFLHFFFLPSMLVFFLWNFERWNSTLYTIRMENYASGFLLYILILVFPYFHIYLLVHTYTKLKSYNKNNK